MQHTARKQDCSEYLEGLNHFWRFEYRWEENIKNYVGGIRYELPSRTFLIGSEVVELFFHCF
jgi:hypothetical protein